MCAEQNSSTDKSKKFKLRRYFVKDEYTRNQIRTKFSAVNNDTITARSNSMSFPLVPHCWFVALINVHIFLAAITSRVFHSDKQLRLHATVKTFITYIMLNH